MSSLLTKNAINSLLSVLDPDLFTAKSAIAILDLIILEADHYVKVEDIMALLITSRNLIDDHINLAEEEDSAS